MYFSREEPLRPKIREERENGTPGESFIDGGPNDSVGVGARGGSFGSNGGEETGFTEREESQKSISISPSRNDAAHVIRGYRQRRQIGHFR